MWGKRKQKSTIFLLGRQKATGYIKTQEGGDVLLNDDCVEFPKISTDALLKKSKAKFIREKNDVLHCFLKIILKSVEFRKKM